MRNIINIDVREGCSCDAIVATDSKTNEIIIEVITGNDKEPQLELIVNDDSTYIALKANQSNYVDIPSESWVLGGALQFRYVATGRTGEIFTLNFPYSINDITVKQISETEFNVNSKSSGGSGETVEVIDHLMSTDTQSALSANMGRVLDSKVTDANNQINVLGSNITNVSNDLNVLTNNVNVIDSDLDTLLIGINVTGQDFNSLGYRSFIGIGTNMTNAPLTNTSASYLIQQICVSGRILQYAKAVNWGDGELLWFRQLRGIIDGAEYWDNWDQVGLQSDIETLKAQTRKCITFSQRNNTDKIYISASFKGIDKQVIVLKGMGNGTSPIFTLVFFNTIISNKIQIINWGAQLELITDSISYIKDSTTGSCDIKFALGGVAQWTVIDVEFPVSTASMTVSDTQI